jgi:queuine tRNA-ribosyltransferase
MGPEQSIQIQSNLASTIAMAFDECVENPAPYEYVKASSDRTVRWLARCKREIDRLNACDYTINKKQMLFGIIQRYNPDIRKEKYEKNNKPGP